MLGPWQGHGRQGCPREVSPHSRMLCRTGSVSSGGVQPTWVPFSSTAAHRRRLRFALDVYDSEWVTLNPPFPCVGGPFCLVGALR